MRFVVASSSQTRTTTISPSRRLVLRMNDDQIGVEDADADHGIAADAQDEVAVVPTQEARYVDELLDVLLRQDRSAGGYLAHKGKRPRRSHVADDVERAGLGRIPLDEPEAFEIGEVRVHCRRRGEIERRADLPNGRRIAVHPHALADELKYLLLPRCETFHRSSSCGEHVFVCDLRVNTCSCQER